MYKPNFEITSKILNLIAKTSSARDIVFSAQIIPTWEISLRREALLDNTHASTSIEGNTLSEKEVSELSLGREVLKTNKEKQEVLNYLDALSQIDELSRGGVLTKSDFLKAHKWISGNTLDNPDWEGFFRKEQVVVGNKRTGIVSYMPPKAEEVEFLVDEFLMWLNSKKDMHPILEAGAVHYEIARIHPFIDGNGRLARFMATWVLVNRGFDIKKFFALDDYYNSDRRSYYEALKTVDRESVNITKWLEYFCEGVYVSIESVKRKVLTLSGGKKKEGGKQISLNERETKVVEYIGKHGEITNGIVQNILDVKRQVATKELTKLVKKGLIKKIGSFKDARYIFLD